MYWHHGNYSDKHNLALMCQHFWKGFEFFYFTSFFRDLSQLYYKVYLRLCIRGVTACCLCSSWNFSPFPIYIAGKAMIFANSSSCIFQLQNLKPLWVSRIQSAKPSRQDLHKCYLTTYQAVKGKCQRWCPPAITSKDNYKDYTCLYHCCCWKLLFLKTPN